MAKYSIPEVFLSGFQLISKLNTPQVQLIADELNSSEFGLDPRKIAQSLSSKENFNTFKEKDLKVIVETIYSLLRVDDFNAEEKQKVLQEIVKSIVHQSEESEDIDSSILEEYLNIFAGISGRTKQTIKGRQLLKDNEKTIISSKIITDIRVVFDDDLDNTEVKNAVIVHNIKIEYFENLKSKSVFFALDSNDLLDLNSSIKRAIKKEKVLRTPRSIQELSFLSLEEKSSK